MRLVNAFLVLAGLATAATAAAQPALICPTAPAGRPCDSWHFHVQMYRPDTRQFVEIASTADFATQAACDRARDAQSTANAKLADYFRTAKQQFEADRFGPCHCDMTADRTAPNYLSEAERAAQVRLAGEIRLRVREKLLDRNVTSDSEMVRGLWPAPMVTPQLATARVMPPPQSAPAPVLTATEDLKPTKTIDTSKPVAAALDLPLVDIGGAEPGAAAVGVVTPTPATESASPAVDAAAVHAEKKAEPVEEVVVAPPAASEEPRAEAFADIRSTVPEEDVASAEETAEKFVSYETQRIQNVIRASSAIADESIKSKIFEATGQRIQLLSNLRLLIEGSGMRSRLASTARDASDESQRLALIARLFGDDVVPHWAPGDATDVIFSVEPEIAAAPERVLRDTTGQFNTAQKKHALYLLLAQTQPTEDQRLWLASVIEGFLR